MHDTARGNGGPKLDSKEVGAHGEEFLAEWG